MGAIYLDTSVLMALLCPEPETACVRLWFGRSDAADIVSSPWSRSELFSALSVKQRMRQLDQEKVIQARAKGLEILATTRCVDVVTADFDQAAAWCTDAASGLRAPCIWLSRNGSAAIPWPPLTSSCNRPPAGLV